MHNNYVYGIDIVDINITGESARWSVHIYEKTCATTDIQQAYMFCEQH